MRQFFLLDLSNLLLVKHDLRMQCHLIKARLIIKRTKHVFYSNKRIANKRRITTQPTAENIIESKQ